jgi:hypothetical protein
MPDNPACYLRLMAHEQNILTEPMEDNAIHVYESRIQTGQRYRDPDTNFEGVAISVRFHRFGCERVTLRALVDKRVVDQEFEGPGLEPAKTPENLGFNQ